jgi:hypothetical protein
MKKKHITEITCPQQTKAFREVLDKMYQLHLEKNADYSKYNVLATGNIGVVVRLWDKAARMMSLAGFNIADGSYTGEKKAKNEPIEDTLMDMAVYAIIALLVRRGKWGR